MNIFQCLNCGKDNHSRRTSFNKYCGHKCHMEHQYKTNVKNWLDTGKFIATTRKPNWIIRFLTEEYGYKCAECGISEWCNEPIVLELEHRDGNSENNVLENLCLICPNCHSQTDTYKNRNKGNGRHARRQRYAESKSY